MNRISARSGSAFFIILIAIAMLAGLSYAVFKGSRSSMSSLSQDQARLAAQEITQFADTLARTVQTLKLRRCTEGQITFSDSGLPNYTNASAPSDGSCGVFNLSGGKMVYSKPQPVWLDTAKSAQTLYNQWFFTTGSCIPDVGTGDGSACTSSQAEMIIILPWIKQGVCEALNKIALPNLNATPLALSGAYNTGNEADGTFPGGSVIDSAGEEFDRESSGCFQGGGANPTGGYHYYRVLLSR